MGKVLISEQYLSDIGNSLRSKLSVQTQYTPSQMAGAIDSFASIVDAIYPVGSIYMSVNSTSPAILFGGTWVAIENTFLVASGTSFTAGTTGGSSTVTLEVANLPSHTHSVGAHAHGLNSHTHSVGAHAHGLNSHTHSVGAHAHGLNSHTHTSAAHTHGLNNHTHTSAAHTHGLNGHVHTVPAHDHDISSHKHKIDHKHTVTNGANYGFATFDTATDRNGANVGFATGSGRYYYVGWSGSTNWNDTTYSGTSSNIYTNTKAAFNTQGNSDSTTSTTPGSTGGNTGNTTSTTPGATGAATGSTANSTAFNSGAATGNTANSTTFNSGAAAGNTANSTAFDSSSVGSGTAINNLPPYLAVYMWKRTA